MKTRMSWVTGKIPNLRGKQWQLVKRLPMRIVFYYLRMGTLHEILEYIWHSTNGRETSFIARDADSHGVVIEKWVKNHGPRCEWRFAGWQNHLSNLRQFRKIYGIGSRAVR